jgi:hypothetical protein
LPSDDGGRATAGCFTAWQRQNKPWARLQPQRMRPTKKTHRTSARTIPLELPVKTGMLRHRWTWSLIACPSSSPIPLPFAHVPQDSAHGTSKLPVNYFSTALRHENHMVLALPTYMCQTLKILHMLCILPNRAFPGDRAYAISGHAGTASLPGSYGPRPWVYDVLIGTMGYSRGSSVTE